MFVYKLKFYKKSLLKNKFFRKEKINQALKLYENDIPL